MKKRLQITHEDFFRSMANMIAASKRVTMAIAKTKKKPAFFYTIGNQEKQLPELLIIGNFNTQDICNTLNILSDKMLQRLATFGPLNSHFKEEELVSLGGEYPLLIYSASKDAKEKYTFQAGQFYANEDYNVMQVVIPDRKGCYPPDPRCHKDYQVPVLKEGKDGKKADGPGADQKIKGQG